MKEYVDLLLDVQLFENMNRMEIESILGYLNPHVKSYGKGDYVAHSGEKINSIGVVLDGAVEMLKEDVWGNKSILAVIPEKSIFGETFVCNKSHSSTVSFQAMADGAVLFLSVEKMLRSCSTVCMCHRKLIDNLLVLVAQKSITLMEKIDILSKKTLREKILSYLSVQAQLNSSLYFDIPMSRMELADYLCCDRSALSRELSRMKGEGLIDYDKNTFRLYKQAD